MDEDEEDDCDEMCGECNDEEVRSVLAAAAQAAAANSSVVQRVNSPVEGWRQRAFQWRAVAEPVLCWCCELRLRDRSHNDGIKGSTDSAALVFQLGAAQAVVPDRLCLPCCCFLCAAALLLFPVHCHPAVVPPPR